MDSMMPDLPDLLQTIHRAAHRAWAQAGPGLGLSHSEFEYLVAIKAQEARKLEDDETHGQHLHDIVDDLGVSKASASAMVGKLESRGLIARIPCRMDARAQHIVLTVAGEALLQKGQAVYEAVAANLPASARAALRDA